MIKKLFGTRKRIVAIGVTGAVLVGAVAAYAFFTATGSGTGSAKTATSATLTVSQIGAGYDTIIPSGGYHQDQCFQCAQITELGDAVTLANPGAQRLVSVVVAFRNWGGAISQLPVTLTIDSTTNGPFTATQKFDFPAGGARPSVTDISFDLSSNGPFVEQSFVYGLSFDPSPPADSLNIALASSAVNKTIGSETHPGTIWVATTAGSGIAGDFPPCTPGTAGVFAQVITNCGDSAPGNPGAYGDHVGPASADADVPAVEFNVVGGVAAGLTPGGPAQPIDFAITNPGSTVVHVNQVATSISSLSGTGAIIGDEACDPSMYPIAGSPDVAIGSVPPGTSIYSPSGTSISMTDDGMNQDNCQGASVNLAFAAS